MDLCSITLAHIRKFSLNVKFLKACPFSSRNRIHYLSYTHSILTTNCYVHVAEEFTKECRGSQILISLLETNQKPIIMPLKCSKQTRPPSNPKFFTPGTSKLNQAATTANITAATSANNAALFRSPPFTETCAGPVALTVPLPPVIDGVRAAALVPAA